MATQRGYRRGRGSSVGVGVVVGVGVGVGVRAHRLVGKEEGMRTGSSPRGPGS